MMSFTFNSKTSGYADTSDEYNRVYLELQERHINDLLRARGYIYLNQIYEMLGVEWEPLEWDNLCMIYKPDYRLRLAIARTNEDGFDIDII